MSEHVGNAHEKLHEKQQRQQQEVELFQKRVSSQVRTRKVSAPMQIRHHKLPATAPVLHVLHATAATPTATATAATSAPTATLARQQHNTNGRIKGAASREP